MSSNWHAQRSTEITFCIPGMNRIWNGCRENRASCTVVQFRTPRSPSCPSFLLLQIRQCHHCYRDASCGYFVRWSASSSGAGGPYPEPCESDGMPEVSRQTVEKVAGQYTSRKLFRIHFLTTIASSYCALHLSAWRYVLSLLLFHASQCICWILLTGVYQSWSTCITKEKHIRHWAPDS